MPEFDPRDDWIVHRTFHNRMELTIQFQALIPSVTELIAIRKCLPEYTHIAPGALRTQIGGSGRLSLGDMPAFWAHNLIRKMESEGLNVFPKMTSYVSHFFENRTLGTTLHIEDRSAAAQFAQDLIVAGKPVQECHSED